MNSRFINDLKVKHTDQLRGKKMVRVVILEQSFGYYSELLKRSVIVPTGFSSDGASVPSVLHWMYHPFGRYLEAAVVHDWFCVMKQIDSVTAAKVFREAMAVCGVSKWRRAKMYFAVRWFGPQFKAKDNAQ